MTFRPWQNMLPIGRNISRGFPAVSGTTKDFTQLSLSLAELTLPKVPPSTFSILFFHHSTHIPHILCSSLFLDVVTLSHQNLHWISTPSSSPTCQCSYNPSFLLSLWGMEMKDAIQSLFQMIQYKKTRRTQSSGGCTNVLLCVCILLF